jgi:colanic acid biosynthesis glycosyl transferase WcaI
VIVCDWIPPAFGAVGQYALADARKAAAAGRPTTLIGLGGCDRREEERPASGSTAGATLKIVRLSATPARKSSTIKRGLWALKTNLRLAMHTVRTLKKGDDAEIKVTGSPPFLAYMLIMANVLFLRRALTYRITDFYPETAIAARKAAFLKPTVPIFHWLRRLATNIEVLSACQERRLVEAGVAKSKLNIVRDASPVSFSGSRIAATRPFGKGDVVLLYSGNFGIAHEADTFLEAYRLHVQTGSNRVRLWLNATGAKVQTVADYCRNHDLPLHVTSPVPLDQLADLLSSPDAHLVVLDEPFWGLVIPSKIYACIDSGKPVLYVGPSESDVHLLTSAHAGSFSVRNGDVDGCLAALNQLGAGMQRELVLASGSVRSGPGR